MFPSHSPQQAAIAAQLARDLAAYEEGMRAVVRGRWNPALYRSLSDQFDRMQMQAGALPRLAASWSELLISRVELTHALWTGGPSVQGSSKVAVRHAQHCMLIADARRKCEEYLRVNED